MKIDKRNIKHWLYLIVTTVNIFIGLALRIKPSPRRIILYGHKLNGNLLAFYKYIKENQKDYEIYYLTMDPDYYRNIREKHSVLLCLKPADMIKAARAKCFVTDHGLHSLSIYKKFTNIKFFDVWHGIPYKGFDQDDFAPLHNYDQVWVSSPSMKNIYVSKYGFNEEKVKVTGYARTDPLVNNLYNRQEILKKYGLSGFKKIILIAPTWAQDDKGRSIVPFGVPIDKFFTRLNLVAKSVNALIVFRAHLNSAEIANLGPLSNVKIMSYQKYPIAEEFLYIADLLVSDWSSIVFDYLVLRKPTIFLDVKAPFAKGFSYDASYRFGEIVGSMTDLEHALEKYSKKPAEFNKKYAGLMQDVSDEVYNIYADGKSAKRYFENLAKLTNA
ncbi:CDP-glycerol glycerophosphotransferase family protein [Candidatus Dojkabacteria bacterium]|nr:CDP-glycerol glycerophosphotransferase family protein [Candidatus Dojkabacteria bacterium]